MKELERRLNELMNQVTEVTGQEFEYADDAVAYLRESEDDSHLELADEIDDVLYDMDNYEEDLDFGYDDEELDEM